MSSTSVKSIGLFTLKKKNYLELYVINICKNFRNLCKHLIKYTLSAILFSLKISIPLVNFCTRIIFDVTLSFLLLCYIRQRIRDSIYIRRHRGDIWIRRMSDQLTMEVGIIWRHILFSCGNSSTENYFFFFGSDYWITINK